VRFRCAAAGGIRLDVMTRLRGVADFTRCWSRRTVLTLDGLGDVDVLGLADRVLARRTRRDQDWPVIRRLVDSHYRRHAHEPPEARVEIWLRERRTPDTLIDALGRSPERAVAMATRRAATACALGVRSGTLPLAALTEALRSEEAQEREAGEAWWRPLRLELEQMPRAARGDEQRALRVRIELFRLSHGVHQAERDGLLAQEHLVDQCAAHLQHLSDVAQVSLRTAEGVVAPLVQDHRLDRRERDVHIVNAAPHRVRQRPAVAWIVPRQVHVGAQRRVVVHRRSPTQHHP
jgi:hypothetical protein